MKFNRRDSKSLSLMVFEFTHVINLQVSHVSSSASQHEDDVEADTVKCVRPTRICFVRHGKLRNITRKPEIQVYCARSSWSVRSGSILGSIFLDDTHATAEHATLQSMNRQPGNREPVNKQPVNR